MRLSLSLVHARIRVSYRHARIKREQFNVRVSLRASESRRSRFFVAADWSRRVALDLFRPVSAGAIFLVARGACYNVV